MHPLAAQWQARGSFIAGPLGRLFVIDEPPTGPVDGPPVLLLHGFPTCSFDWRQVIDELRTSRRVIAMDFPGYGLSDKPDVDYLVEVLADAVEHVVVACGLEEFDLVTHDMGDTVGGALLARGGSAVAAMVRRRVVTNGSIYLGMAHLRWQQRALLALPDRSLPLDLPAAMYRRGLARIYGDTPADPEELDALFDLFCHDQGNRRVTRLIRYLEQRRDHEPRWTGAIERHPAPLLILWGDADLVARAAMADRLQAARRDATLQLLHGVGHFPMTEAPGPFAAAVRDFLGAEGQ